MLRISFRLIGNIIAANNFYSWTHGHANFALLLDLALKLSSFSSHFLDI